MNDFVYLYKTTNNKYFILVNNDYIFKIEDNSKDMDVLNKIIAYPKLLKNYTKRVFVLQICNTREALNNCSVSVKSALDFAYTNYIQ